MMRLLSWFKSNNIDEEPYEDGLSSSDVFEDSESAESPSPDPSPPTFTYNPKTDHTAAVTFDNIADQFVLLQTKVADLEAELADTIAKLGESKADNHELTQTCRQLRSHNESHEATAMTQRNVVLNLDVSNKSLKRQQRFQSTKITELTSRIRTSDGECAALQYENRKLQTHILHVNEKAQDLTLDLELLKCTADPAEMEARAEKLDFRQSQLTPQPFVAVLVDGDAYSVRVPPGYDMHH